MITKVKRISSKRQYKQTIMVFTVGRPLFFILRNLTYKEYFIEMKDNQNIFKSIVQNDIISTNSSFQSVGVAWKPTLLEKPC